jgi:hypothetical protein
MSTSNRPIEINQAERVKVSYRGLVVGINPAEQFVRVVNKEFKHEKEYKYFPVRVSIAFSKELYNGNWEKIYNPSAKEEDNKGTYFFEHLWAAIPESIVVNGESRYTLNELITLVQLNKSKGIRSYISKAELSTGIILNYSRSVLGNSISKVEVTGLGPLYPRIHKPTGKPFIGRDFGEVYFHLDKASISLISHF